MEPWCAHFWTQPRASEDSDEDNPRKRPNGEFKLGTKCKYLREHQDTAKEDFF
jgi:hypothetical protein